MQQHEIVGTWALRSFVATGSNGERRDVWGERPTGQLIYTSDGHMAVVMARSDRMKFVSADPLGGTPEEVKQAFEGMEAYAGTYHIDSDRGAVIHQTNICRLPNWEGGNQLRYASLSADELTLRTAPVQVRGGEWVLTLVWHRVA